MSCKVSAQWPDSVPHQASLTRQRELNRTHTSPLAIRSSLPFWGLRCLSEPRTLYQFLSHTGTHARQLGFECVSNEPFGLLSPEIIILHLQQSLLHSLSSCSTVQLLVPCTLSKDGITHCPSTSLIASCLGQKSTKLSSAHIHKINPTQTLPPQFYPFPTSHPNSSAILKVCR